MMKLTKDKVEKCLKIHQLKIMKIIKKTAKKACQRYQSLSKEKKRKREWQDTKVYQKMKNQKLVDYGEKEN